MRKNKAVVIKERKERKEKNKKKDGGGLVNFAKAALRGAIQTDKLYDLAYKDRTINKIPDLINKLDRDKTYLIDEIEKYKKQKERIDSNRHDARAEELTFEEIEAAVLKKLKKN